MAIYVGFETAVGYWLAKSGDEAVPDGVPTASLADATANRVEIANAPLPFEYSKKRPLHVLVGNKALKRNWENVVCHVWSGKVVPGSFNELLGSCRVSSPEFTFLQMASVLPLRQAVELGDYLCGAFCVDASGRDYAGSREPLTDVVALASFVERAKGSYGAYKARMALRYVVPGLASPMEVVLAMLFEMPLREGGWGMPPVVANQPLTIPDEVKPMAEAEQYVGDLYFPSIECDVEYDSRTYHTGAYRLDHDQMRRNIMEIMGVRTMSATWGQINTFEKLCAFMWSLKKRFGIRWQRYPDETRKRQEELYDYLMDRKRTMF